MLGFAFALVVALNAAAGPLAMPSAAVATVKVSQAPAVNPLSAAWSGPYGGVPPFNSIKVEDFQPALEAGMAAQLAAIDRFTSNLAPATFENTIAAMERSGRVLERALTLYEVWSATHSTPEFQAVEIKMAPKLAAFSDKVTQNPKLFARIAAVHETILRSSLTPEQQRLTWLYYQNFVRSGARLDAASKARVSTINTELAKLYTSSVRMFWVKEV